MAKKSAKSKGYRRQTAKKPYLSKRDIAILCGIVAVLAVAAFFLFRYDDGALKVKDGAVVTEGDNWLIVDGSNVRGRARYFKLGEIGEIDGKIRELSRAERDNLLVQTAEALGFQGDDAAEIMDTINSIYEATDSGWGWGGPGGGGRRGGRGGRGGPGGRGGNR